MCLFVVFAMEYSTDIAITARVVEIECQRDDLEGQVSLLRRLGLDQGQVSEARHDNFVRHAKIPVSCGCSCQEGQP